MRTMASFLSHTVIMWIKWEEVEERVKQTAKPLQMCDVISMQLIFDVYSF